MNTLFSVIRNAKFVQDEKYKLFLSSLKNLDVNDKVVILNTTSLEIKIPNKNCQVINVASMNSDLNIYGTMSGYLNQNKLNEDDYVIVCDIENVVLTRNPFSYLKYFKKDLYFYGTKYVANETDQKKLEYENFMKTCNFYLGNDFDSYSLETHFFGGKSNAFKALLLTLYLEVNRNSANLITSQAVLSYTHKHFFSLYDVSMLTNQFCKIVENQNMAESIFTSEEQSKKQYLILY